MNLENMANMLYANMIFLVFNSKVIILLFSVIVFSSVKGDGCLSKHLLLEHKYSKPFNSHEWPSQNFSLHYQYSIKQTNNEDRDNVNKGIISWFSTKFSELTSQELYHR